MHLLSCETHEKVVKCDVCIEKAGSYGLLLPEQAENAIIFNLDRLYQLAFVCLDFRSMVRINSKINSGSRSVYITHKFMSVCDTR
jgi:hypothetical protein